LILNLEMLIIFWRRNNWISTNYSKS